MTTQNMAMQFLVNKPVTKDDYPKPEKPTNNDSNFKSVYSSVCSKPDDPKITNDAQNVSKDQQVYKTYHEAMTARCAEKKPNKTVQVKTSEGTAADQSSHEDLKTGKDASALSVEETLSKILCIPANEIVKLLGSMNIKPEDLTDPAKASKAIEKLGSMLGLNSAQKQVLKKVIDMAAKSCIKINPSETQKSASDTDIKPEAVKAQESEPQKIMNDDTSEKVKKALDSIIKKSGNDEQGILTEITARIDSKSDKSSEADEKKEQNNSPILTSEKSKDTKEEKTVKNPKQKNETGTEAKETDAEPKSDNQKKEVHNVVLKEANVQHQTNNDTTVIPSNQQVQNIQKTGEVHEPAELHAKAPVSKDEIIKQVVEKAKFVLDGNKSEMVMDLKPDNLGRLSLKVVTENGIVAAKFIAENQQVKETLETNMQLLKDSLEKQGLSVQEFSVSVGNNNSGRQDGQWNGQGSRMSGGSKTAPAGLVSVSPEMIEKKINPYYEGDSSINLTA